MLPIHVRLYAGQNWVGLGSVGLDDHFVTFGWDVVSFGIMPASMTFVFITNNSSSLT
jgi:hypothetical protein